MVLPGNFKWKLLAVIVDKPCYFSPTTSAQNYQPVLYGHYVSYYSVDKAEDHGIRSRRDFDPLSS